MNRPDYIILNIDFNQTDKFKAQVSSKNLILGDPNKNKTGILENYLENELGMKTITCHKFALVKYPITLPSGRAENRARGAIGVYQFIGSMDSLEPTILKMKEFISKIINLEKYSIEGTTLVTKYWDKFNIYIAYGSEL